MPPERKPRPIVNDLQVTSRVTPQANPNTANVYIRPGAPEIQRPQPTNPFLKLSESLSSLNSELQPIMKQVSERLSKEEEAKLLADFQKNRAAWNDAVRRGEIPLGASPHAARAVHRLMLSELADDYLSTVSTAFQGEAGAAARKSNDPRVMRQFLDSQMQSFYSANLKNGERELYSPLDLQESWQPKIEHANSQLLRAHSQYRVQEVERELVDNVGASVSRTIEDTFKDLQPTTPEIERNSKLSAAADKIMDTLYNPDHGAVRNGLGTKKAGDLIIDTVIARALAKQDRSILEVIPMLRRPDGPSPLTIVPEIQKKITQAEEHLTSLQIQEENHAWQLEQRPYQRASLQRQAQEHEHQDKLWEQQKQDWARQEGQRAEGDNYRQLLARLYQGMDHPDSKKGVAIINDVIRTAKQILPEKVEALNEVLAVTHQRKAHTEDDRNTVAQIYLDLDKDPLSFDVNRLARAVKTGTLTTSTMRSIFDDVDKKRANASHPYMRQTEITEMIGQLGRGAVGNPDDEYSVEGALRQSEAIGSFRDRAADWIKTHPQGSMEAFREYMRNQVQPILERVQKDFGVQQEIARKAEEKRGQMVVDRTGQEVTKREAQQKAEAAKAQAAQEVIKQREQFNQSLKPIGKTKEGRTILQNDKGQVVTERTITVHGIPEINGGGITNIPTVFNGKVVSDEEAIKIMKDNKGVDPETGQRMRRYWSIKDAEIAARERSARLGKEYSQQQPTK